MSILWGLVFFLFLLEEVIDELQLACLNKFSTCLKNIKKNIQGLESRWLRNKKARSASSPQIHQKFICIWNNSNSQKGKPVSLEQGRAKDKDNERNRIPGQRPEGGEVSAQ